MSRVLRCCLLIVTITLMGNAADWKGAIDLRLPEYGHRNWIVIADSAYPAQSRAGIETVLADTDQMQVLQYVLQAISRSKHVRSNIFLDEELQFVPEADAPGIDAYRGTLHALLDSYKPVSLRHERIIENLDKAGETFRILIIKTNLTLPYTSVFVQLDCAYWSAEAEQRLRKAIAQRSR